MSVHLATPGFRAIFVVAEESLLHNRNISLLNT